MPDTRVPGIAAKHVVITDDCRAIHGDGGAFNKAAIQLLAEFNDIVSKRSGEKGVNYHLVLTVEDTKGCICRSYHERTGEHVYQCPLADRDKVPTEVLRKPRGGHMASMPEPRPPAPPNPRDTA